MDEQLERDGYSIKEFAKRSGMSISTVRRRIKDGSLPIVQLGGPSCLLTIPADALRQIYYGNHLKEEETTSEKDVAEKTSTFSEPDSLSGPKPKWKTKYPN